MRFILWFHWQAKVMAAEKTEQDIDATRLQYVPVAVRARLLFFCVLDLSNLEPMYHYSLEWFIGIFMTAVANSNTAGRKTYVCADENTKQHKSIKLNKLCLASLFLSS